MILFTVWFEKIEMVGLTKELHIKFGPCSNRIEVCKVISSWPIAIKQCCTYMGIHQKVGSIGFIGYITGAKTGVKLEIEGKKRNYVLSINSYRYWSTIYDQ